MRVDNIKGVYLRYKDVAQPAENLDRVKYVFNRACNRTCLVESQEHIKILMSTGKYLVVGVETLEDVETNGVSPETVIPQPVIYRDEANPPGGIAGGTTVHAGVPVAKKKPGRKKGSKNKRSE